ncbi:MAG: PASTA domain-containing protein, partial [Eubacterium sp.]|nr:PASTA domain-containing protein [Eubacterium sp.]
MAKCLGCMKEHNEKNGVCPYCGYDNNSKPTEAYHMVPGSILEGRYLIGRCVGQGGFGITYIGWDLQLERKIAVKEYFPSDFATRALGEQQLTIYNGDAADQFGAGLKSFIDEAQRLAKFNGIKGIVDIYDTFITNNTGYIVMEFLSGVSVKDMLKANGTLDYPTAKEIVVEMLYILNEVHKEGIIHRDIAPDNIFITDEGEFKLLDFGAARYASIVNSKSLSVILKPGYAPAEQYRRRGNQGPWTDIYALAATFYKLITGVTPPESMERINGDNLVPPSKLGVQIPKNDEIILLNALNVMPENRVQNAKEFLDALGGKRAVRKRERNLGADTGKMYKFAIPLLVISLIFVGAFGVYVKAGGIDMEYVGEIVRGSYEIADGFAIVRNVVGKDREQAEKLLNMDGFKVEIGESIYIDVIDEGKVAAQTPSSGSASTEDTVITLVVSLGAQTGDIGAYINRSADEVMTELKAAGFYNIDTMPGEKNELPEGTVEAVKSNAEEIAENSQVKLSSPIVLYVSDGSNFEIDETKDVKVPNVTKKKYTDASSTIVENKLIVGSVSYEYSSSVKEGYVISQSPS